MSKPAQTLASVKMNLRSKGSRTQRPEQASNHPPKKRGRKPGKHSDANYTQTSLYLPIELRNKVRAKLYEQGKEFSGLIENMLREWLLQQA